MVAYFVISIGLVERETDCIVDSIHHALVLISFQTIYLIVCSSFATTLFPTSYIFLIYQYTTFACFVHLLLIILHRYNVAFFNSKGKSGIISDCSNRQSNISYFTFRSYINPHLLNSYTSDNQLYFEFSLRFSKNISLVLTL